MTGIEFFIGKRGPGPHPYSPTIDRIDSSGGYTQDNCRFILWAINAIKHMGTDEQIYALAKALIEHREKTLEEIKPASHTNSTYAPVERKLRIYS